MKFNALIPELTVFDITKTKEFYVSILGFHIEYERPEEKFMFLSFGEMEVPLGRGINFSIESKQIEKLYDIVIKADISVYRELNTTEYLVGDERKSQTEFLIQDPDGYLLRFVS